ncbi:MAG: hypothetical protein NC204_00990 [Candidatus Amulumruptor caecigallinarius]|nr:hypothetical protein [Candidatus Amulumruptor caecigallinarius]
MREIKQLFFTFRNGIVADALRKAGYPHKMIFGLELPRIAEMARELGPDDVLAEKLWNDRDVRESRLLAVYLMQPDNVSADDALRLASDVRTVEEADMLSFRLFKRMKNPVCLHSSFIAAAANADSLAVRTALMRAADALARHIN